MKNKVVIIDWGYKSFSYEKNILENAGYSLDVFGGNRSDRAGKMNFAKDAVGIFCRWTVIDEEFLNALSSLKAIVRYGVGYDNIDLEAATKRGIPVCNVQGYANHSVSDHALAFLFGCLRALPLGEKGIIKDFSKPPIYEIFELHDKTLGIIGLGRIGGTFCQKARSLFERVIASDPYIPDERFTELGAIKTDLPWLLSESNVISIHCCLTPETTHLIGRKQFRQMKKIPILINTARGPVIDEVVLLEALENNMIHSAGLDVFENEPPVGCSERLYKNPRVIATGHYAWYSDAALKNLQQRAAQNMLKLLQNKIPEDCLNF
jgi:D-3-phosphoglycerate dehydrogenase